MSTRGDRWLAIDASVERVRPLFWVITGEDFAREIRRARGLRNSVSDQIREKILNLKLGKSTPGDSGKNL